MKYNNVYYANFIERPNRFIAWVELDGQVETVHVKNTGRCKELLLPGVKVLLQKTDNPQRKTQYDLISVYKEGLGWVNIDSQVPNKVVREWLESGDSIFKDITLIRPEYTFGNSRVDFYIECQSCSVCERGFAENIKNKAQKTTGLKDNTQSAEQSDRELCEGTSEVRKILIEVKGCTLEIDGIGYFPDAPTERGVKHLMELASAVDKGYECYVAFVIAMPLVNRVYPNVKTHPEFGTALEYAQHQGVHILHLSCDVEPDELSTTGCKQYESIF